MFFIVYKMTTREKIKELNERYKIILNEFAHTYPQYKVYPEIETISQSFAADSGNLLELQTEFFQLRDNIQHEIQERSNKIDKTDIQIKILEEKNNKLMGKLNGLENETGNLGFVNVVDAFHTVGNGQIQTPFYHKDYNSRSKKIIIKTLL